MTTEQEFDGTRVVQNTASISLLKSVGLFAGLILDALLAARFGVGAQMDALFTALTLPLLVSAVLVAGFKAVLVPAFSHAKELSGEDASWDLYNRVATLALLVVAVVALVGALTAGQTVSLIAPGLDASTNALASRLSRISFLMLVPAGLVEVSSAMLHTLFRFAVPASMKLVQSSIALLCALVGLSRWGVAAVPFGYCAGALAQLALMGFEIRRLGGRYRPALAIGDPEVSGVMRQLLPLVAQSAVGQATTVAERVLGSLLPPGSVSALAFARRILRAVTSLSLDTVSAALLPPFSALSARDNLTGLVKAAGFGIRLVSFLTLPAVTLLSVLNVPFVRLLFQRGAFDASATSLTGGLMALFVLSVPVLAVFQILVNAMFAMRDTLTPIALRLFSLAVNIALDVALVGAIGSYGLALSLLLARVAGLGVALRVFGQRVDRQSLGLRGYFLKLTLALAALGAVAIAVQGFGARLVDGGFAGQLLVLSMSGLLAIVSYAAVCAFLGIGEVKAVTDLLGRRLGRQGTGEA